jgi:catechol 2,3-dioxygenase-like lactoylglutathione lyase family enzyme
MIEHISLRCSDPHKSREFYVKALEPLGYEQDWKFGDSFAFVTEGHHEFWVTRGKIGTPTHLAFRAKDRQTVDAFHEAAVAAGGQDNGKPGLRPEETYGKNYYAAFVLDPDGHNIEAVSFSEK